MNVLLIQGSTRTSVGHDGDATLVKWCDRQDVFVPFSQSKLLSMIPWDCQTVVRGFDVAASDLGLGETWGTFGSEMTL